MKTKAVIEEGDTVILYIDVKTLKTLRVTRTIVGKDGKEQPHVVQTIYGQICVANLIGKPFGHRLNLAKGFVYLMYPTPEMWTLALPHRTQIIYTPDISMVIAHLDLSPGKIVCEAGTGSGSLSFAILRAVAPTGTLYTYDFHEERVKMAMDDFRRHGFEANVVATHRDVCTNPEGFGEAVEGQADAVFLDLPHPWEAISAACKALKRGGRICSFSPCVEQVQKMCDELRANGFEEVRTFEMLTKESIVKVTKLPVPEVKDHSEFLNGPVVKKSKMGGEDDGSKGPSYALPVTTSPGHTGFLSFATRVVGLER